MNPSGAVGAVEIWNALLPENSCQDDGARPLIPVFGSANGTNRVTAALAGVGPLTVGTPPGGGVTNLPPTGSVSGEPHPVSTATSSTEIANVRFTAVIFESPRPVSVWMIC